MIQKVVIRDNKKTPVRYLNELKAFKNGGEYVFTPGVNVIVGENGCGKTTLMKLIQAYMLVGQQQCDESKVSDLFDSFRLKCNEEMLDGVEVFADYETNVFRLAHPDEYKGERGIGLQSFANFGAMGMMYQSSTGERVTVALNNLWKLMFSEDAVLTFPQLNGWRLEKYGAYLDYVKKHKVEQEEREWTILMDEPDNNLDIENIKQIRSILSFHKPQTQVIAVVHNPLLIVSLSRNPEVNMIEMTRGYVKKVESLVTELVGGKTRKYVKE